MLDDLMRTSSTSSYEEPTWKKVVKSAKEALEKFEKKVWKYLKGAIKFTKSIIKISILGDSEAQNKVGRVFTYFGLLSIIKLLFNGKSLSDSINNLSESKKLHDQEGVIVSSLETGMESVDTLSSLLNLGETLHKLKVIPWLTLFSIVAVPLAITSLCYSLVKGIYKLIVLGIELHKMPTFPNDHISSLESVATFKRYLEEKIGVTEEEKAAVHREVLEKYSEIFDFEMMNSHRRPYNPHAGAPDPVAARTAENIDQHNAFARAEVKKRLQLIKDRKINIMKRNTDKTVVKVMVHANKHLIKHQTDIKRANDSFKDIKKLCARKAILGGAETFLKVAETITYIAAFFFPMIAIASLSISLVKSTYSVGEFAYKEHMMTKGLRYWEFMDYSPLPSTAAASAA